MKRVEIINSFPLEIIDIGNENINKKNNNCISSKIVDDYFIKVLDRQKIEKLYSGDYFYLWHLYYEEIIKYVNLNKIFGLVETSDGKFVEIQRRISREKIFDIGSCNIKQFDEMLTLYKTILDYIDKLLAARKTDKLLGLESAIWNFSSDGNLFDIDPPRILMADSDTSFTRKDNLEHITVTKYRNFDKIGMRLNLLATFLLSIKDKNFIIENLPENYFTILLKELNAFLNKDDQKKIIEAIGNDDQNLYNSHPVKVIKKLYKGEMKNG